jgi:hypothetical protein
MKTFPQGGKIVAAENSLPLSAKALTGRPFGALSDLTLARWLHKKRALTTSLDALGWRHRWLKGLASISLPI